MQEAFDFFSGLGAEWALFIISMLPLIELRGSIIVGAATGMLWLPAYLISVAGSMLPAPAVILFGRKIISWFKKIPLFSPLVEKYEKKLLKKADKVVKYELAGLLLFVAVPLPGTGVWTGSFIAALLDLRMKFALPVILLGNCIAGAIMLFLSYGTAELLKGF
ncbi:MAG: small multi-drug export protein [Bacillota bacterium]|nr:small multi-drug export protein [Bacillota bacterium]